jgi:hypothetical protein
MKNMSPDVIALAEDIRKHIPGEELQERPLVFHCGIGWHRPP